MWLLYFFSDNVAMWDWVHKKGEARFGAGGIWHYGDWMKQNRANVYLQHQIKADLKDSSQDTLRILDVSCSVGIVLADLRDKISTADAASSRVEIYGSDISHVMANASAKRCASCHVAQYDIGRLQRDDRSEDGSAVYDAFAPDVTEFDYVLVSDVLYYIGWGGWMPIVLKYCSYCRQFKSVQSAYKRFAKNIQSITRKQVIFSNHQSNPIIIDFFKAVRAGYVQGSEVFVLSGRNINDQKSINN